MSDQMAKNAKRIRDRYEYLRFRIRHAYGPAPIELLRWNAYVELHCIKTITAYKFNNGTEIRRPGDPFVRLIAALDKMAKAFEQINWMKLI